jgi:hypothetical protein
MFVGAPLKVMLVNDRARFPWFVLEPQQYDCELTGETYIIERGFRTDGSSVPIAISHVPLVGAMLLTRYFGGGVFKGFREGVLHDRLRRKDAQGKTLVSPKVAHLVFREALYTAGYPEDMIENYYAAVRLFNS